MGETARIRTGVVGEDALPGGGEEEKLTLWLSEERRVGVAGAGEEVDKGRLRLDVDAEG